MHLDITKESKTFQSQSRRHSLTFDINIHTGLAIRILDVSDILVATCEVSGVTSFCVEDGELVASNKGVIRAGLFQDAGPTPCRPHAPGPGNGSQSPENTTQKKKNAESGMVVAVKK